MLALTQVGILTPGTAASIRTFLDSFRMAMALAMATRGDLFRARTANALRFARRLDVVHHSLFEFQLNHPN